MMSECSTTIAVIILDPQDIVIKSTFEFIAKILGEQFFDVFHGQESGTARKTGPRPGERARDNINYEKDFFTNTPVSDFSIQFKSKSSPADIKFLQSSIPLCHFPFLLEPCDPLVCYGGLSTVVRRMVHLVDRADPKRKAVSLLGEDETCLKAYAEVSNWTKFCEADLPRLAKNLCNTHETSKEHVTCASIPHELKLNLLRLEKELQTAKNIKNKRKYHGNDQMKWIRKLVDNSFEGQYFSNKRREEYVNDIITGLKKMWSPYLTGFQMTVADLLAASMIFQIFAELSSLLDLNMLETEVPLVFRWLRQMLSVPAVRRAAENSWVEAMSISKLKTVQDTLPTWEETLSDVEPVSQTKVEQKNSKIKVNHQSEISNTLRKMQESGLSPTYSDFSCPEIDWENIPSDLNPSKGDLNPDRALRKQKQIENIFSAVKSLAKFGNRIVDFCAGGGHVGIVLAYFLPFCEVILVENKEQSVARAVSRIRSLGLKNMRICHSNLDYFRCHFDVGVTLHACGVATDLVLNACLRERASFVVCPCCYGSIKNLEVMSFPRSRKFQCRTVLEEYLILTHSADMTSWDKDSVKTRFAMSSMGLIDLDRRSFMEEHGYVTKLCIMIPANCTPKNHILIGELTS